MYNIPTVCACDINQGAFTQYASLGAQLFVIRAILASQYSVAQGGDRCSFLKPEKNCTSGHLLYFTVKNFCVFNFFFSIAYH